MSKFLDKDGLAHLWERIQELVATCGGGGNYKSEKLSLVQPNEDGYLYPHNLIITGHNAFSIDPTVSTRGTLEVGLSQKPSNLAVAVAFQGIQSSYNGLPFDKVKEMYYDLESRTYKIRLQSDTPISLNANDISIEVVEFLYGGSHEYNACVLVGECDEGGGEIIE